MSKLLNNCYMCLKNMPFLVDLNHIEILFVLLCVLLDVHNRPDIEIMLLIDFQFCLFIISNDNNCKKIFFLNAHITDGNTFIGKVCITWHVSYL